MKLRIRNVHIFAFCRNGHFLVVKADVEAIYEIVLPQRGQKPLRLLERSRTCVRFTGRCAGAHHHQSDAEQQKTKDLEQLRALHHTGNIEQQRAAQHHHRDPRDLAPFAAHGGGLLHGLRRRWLCAALAHGKRGTRVERQRDFLFQRGSFIGADGKAVIHLRSPSVFGGYTALKGRAA